MRTIYIECGMGIAGDMLMGALYELLDDAEQNEFIRSINSAGIPEVTVRAEESIKCGVKGTHMEVKVFEEEEGHSHGHHHGHSHNHGKGIEDIEIIIKELNLSQGVKEKALHVYRRIAMAEAAVHGEKPEHIHFHEVGSLDAVADVAGCCMLIEKLGADKIVFSPINTGSGSVHCAHGILPVPAPATAELLKGIPAYSDGEVRDELCTPTGAALAGEFAEEFGQKPMMKTIKIGYGMGSKDFRQANCVRAVLGETEGKSCEKVIELAANIDDMNGEELGFALERLLEAGALDVYTQPIYMKKNRPAVKLCVIVPSEEAERMAGVIFQYTTTLGIRVYTCDRYRLERHVEKKNTAFGEICVKVSRGYGITKEKYEYEDLAEIARREEISLAEARKRIDIYKEDITL
ncbi:MAG: nickel pincer cofactor biosynthesis protein LarC [Anaerovoracaceae bacterium]